jgi:hypothetical protein
MKRAKGFTNVRINGEVKLANALTISGINR